MSSLGFADELSLGNQATERILGINARLKEKRLENIKNAKTELAGLDTSGRETKTIGEAVVGQVASKGKDIQAGVKIVKSVPKALGVLADNVEKYAIGGTQKAFEGIHEGIYNLVKDDKSPLFVRQEPSIFKSDAQIVKEDPTNLPATLREANRIKRGTTLGEDVSGFLKTAGATGETIGARAGSIGKLGIASTGLTVGLGVMDAVEDIKSGKIEGNNSAERVSNVATQISGALEGVGTALDLTGVGAEAGVALNLLGGAVGLIGAGAEAVGEIEEETSAKKKVQQVQQKQVQPVAVGVTGEAGVEVKPN